MPELIWSSKGFSPPEAAKLRLDSRMIPPGAGSIGKEGEDAIILGDNLGVMQALLPDYEGKIDLIYADPPFFTNRAYPTRVGRGEDSRRPHEWQLAEGYPDSWHSMDEYLDMLYPRLKLMHRLLSPQGTLYLHLDWHANAYARLLLDEIFGVDRLVNEIIWLYHGPSPIRRAFNRKHDTILCYAKGDDYIFNVDEVRQPYAENTVRTFIASPKAGFGKMPDLARGKVPEDWWYYPVVARLHGERTGYPTQKPEALLERIVRVSSKPDSVVADFFCGSGTTAAIAARLGRRYIASDVSWRAVHFSRARLLNTAQRGFQIYVDEKVYSQDWFSYQPAPPGLFSLQMTDGGLTIKLSDELLRDLDYWEVDPQWDGEVFTSCAQAHRTFRKGGIAVELEVKTRQSLGEKIAVRMVKVDGSQEGYVFSAQAK